MLQDRANDAVMVIHAPNALIDSRKMALAAVEAVKKHRRSSISPKPVFAVWYGADEEVNRIFEDARIPHYQRGAVAGFMHMVNWRKAREALMAAPPSLPVDFAPNTVKARAVIAQAISRGHEWLAPVEISALLEAYDIPIAPARLARSPEEAAEVAQLVLGRYGGCVVKIMSRDIIHKSDLGGVALDQRSIEQVVDTTARCWSGSHWRRRTRGSTASPSTRWCAAQRPRTDDGRRRRPHLRAGDRVRSRRQGGGGHHDKALAMPPLDLSLARALIEQTQVVRALRDYRDVPAADIDAVALLLVKIRNSPPTSRKSANSNSIRSSPMPTAWWWWTRA